MTDPEQYSLNCMPVVEYARAYGAWMRADPHELKRWEGNDAMDMVKQRSMERAAAEIEKGQG